LYGSGCSFHVKRWNTGYFCEVISIFSHLAAHVAYLFAEFFVSFPFSLMVQKRDCGLSKAFILLEQRNS